MPGVFTIDETLNTLNAIFEKHKEERICVIGTICAGKSTLLSKLTVGEDLDAVLWPNIPKEETTFLNQEPWTEEMSAEVDRLVYKYVKVKPGQPLFTSVIVDCEVVVYLDISDSLLADHCKKRGKSFKEAKNIKEAIEGDWNHHKAKGGKVFYYVTITE